MNEQKEPEVSIVVPIYNEQGSVETLHREIVSTVNNLNISYEIIFVDDGSIDEAFNKLQNLSPIKIIKFRKNFGQTAAMDAGIKSAEGKYIITMDGDLQNDPKDISKLLEKIKEENLDVVAGWRKNRQDSFSKKFFSKCAARLRKILIDDGIHDSGCTLKIYRSDCFKNTDLVGEMHRFIPGILKIKGFKIGEIVVNHRQRQHDKTKYGITRGIRGVLDMFSVWFWKNMPADLFIYLVLLV